MIITPAAPSGAEAQLQRWLDGLRSLHARNAAGKLDGLDRPRYAADRRRLLEGLVDDDNRRLRAGQRRRGAFRLARAVQVRLTGPGGERVALTQNFSTGGFAALVAPVPKAGDAFEASLRLPGGAQVTARAVVVDVRPPRGGAARTGFRFAGLPACAAEAIECAIVETVLASLG